MKSKRNEEGLKGRLLVSVASCLGVCPNEGTTVAIAPAGGEPVLVVMDPIEEKEALWLEAKKKLQLDSGA